jgi:hypothetical protein
MCAPKESKFMGDACLKNFSFGRCKNVWGFCLQNIKHFIQKYIAIGAQCF